MAILRFALFFILLSLNAEAQEVHFFGSLDYARTTTKNDVEYGSIQNKFSTSNLNTAGVNVSANIDNKSQVLVQVIHAPQPNKVMMDLIQFQRTFPDEIKVRLGKQRLPTFLKSEVIQVKALYPWTIAPIEVYTQIPVRSFTGATVEKEWGKISMQAYAGDVKDEFYQANTEIDLTGRQLIGGRLNFHEDTLEAYVNFMKVDGELSYLTPVTIAPNVTANSKLNLKIKNLTTYTAGFSKDYHKWLLMTEFIHITSNSSLLKAVDAGYLSLGYHLHEDFLILGTFSDEFSRKSNLSPSKGTTYDLTLQYNIDMNTVVKLGVSHVNHRRKEAVSSLSPSGISDSGNAISGPPGNNFNVYDLQLAFVF